MTSVCLREWAVPAKGAVRKFAGRWLRRQFLTHKRWLLDQTDSLPLGIMAVRTCYSHFVSKIIRGNHWELNHWIQLGLKASLPLDFQWNELMFPLTTWARTKDLSCVNEYFLTGRMDNCFFFFFLPSKHHFLFSYKQNLGFPFGNYTLPTFRSHSLHVTDPLPTLRSR